jgi:uncharacterized membrane protein
MPRSMRWLGGGLGALAVLALVGGDHGAVLWPFVGRLHPLLVHFPLAVLLLAIGLEATHRWTRADAVRASVPVLLLVGAWSAIVASGVGLVLGDWGSYDPDTLQRHKRFGLIIPVLAALAYWVRARQPIDGTGSGIPSRVVAGLLGAALLVGGHAGGTLSRGDDYLTRFLPERARALAGLPGETDRTRIHVANADATPVYDSLVQPVLTARCGACHNADRKKGGLVLTSIEGLLAGGRQGKVVAPGRADDSELIIRLTLPPGHTDAMPPDRAMPVSEVAMIRWWIDQGASKEITLAAIARPASIRRTLAAYGLDELPTGIFALPVSAPDSVALRAARESGLTVLALGNGVGYLSIDASSVPPSWSSQSLQLLRPLAANIASIDLARAPVGDSALAVVSSMPRLTRLRLAQTQVTDAGLVALKSLQYLAYLNLVDTEVTDAGLRSLETLPRLASLYLGGTQVTAGGIERLQRALPRTRIVMDEPTLTELESSTVSRRSPSGSAARP